MARRLILFVLVLVLAACSATSGPPTGQLPPPSAGGPTVQPAGNSLPPLRVHFIDVGQGDATLIQAPDGKAILVDGGQIDTGVVGYLHSVGVRAIDVMIATHPHSDHIGGLLQVLEAMPVAQVITNGQPYTTPTNEHFLEAIEAAQARYVTVRRGDLIRVGGVSLQVLHPAEPLSSEANENSIVLRFVYGKTALLLMGDAGQETEYNLLAAGVPLTADILKVGHHAASSGTTLKFLRAVKPSLAVYFAGVDNDYHYPASRTVAALKSVGARVLGTDVDGTIVVTVDQSGYSVRASKK